jgi:hypothetical protein
VKSLSKVETNQFSQTAFRQLSNRIGRSHQSDMLARKTIDDTKSSLINHLGGYSALYDLRTRLVMLIDEIHVLVETKARQIRDMHEAVNCQRRVWAMPVRSVLTAPCLNVGPSQPPPSGTDERALLGHVPCYLDSRANAKRMACR